MPKMDAAERERFLARTRLGILSSNRKDGRPLSVPVWFDWDGRTVRMFAAKDSPKVRRLTADPRVSLLAVNHLDEPEGWVAFDGEVTIGDGDFALVEKLAERYWDLELPVPRDTLAAWRAAKDAFCFLEFEPTEIRSGA